MNKKFDIRRFGKYLWKYIVLNKVYLMILTLIFMVPTLLIKAEEAIWILILGCAILPIRTNTPGSPQRHLLPDSSTFEKFATETILKMLFIGIPYVAHAIMVGADSLEATLTGGFQPLYLSVALLCTWLTTLLTLIKWPKTQQERKRFGIIWCSILYVNLFMTSICSRLGDKIPEPKTSTVTAVLFAIGIVLFVVSYRLFGKRYEEYERED